MRERERAREEEREGQSERKRESKRGRERGAEWEKEREQEREREKAGVMKVRGLESQNVYLYMGHISVSRNRLDKLNMSPSGKLTASPMVNI